jgi:hypothetical protein
MSQVDQDQLAVDIARRFIAQSAPQELPLFQGISEEFLQNSRRILKQPTGKDELLGFGVAEGVILLAPIVLSVTNTVITSIAQKTAESLWSRIWNARKNLFRKSKTKQRITIPPLTAEQLAAVREQAHAKALSLKLPEPQATLLAESIVGRLATMSVDKEC